MRIKSIVVLACAVFVTPARAQAEPDVTYSGRWSATIVANDGTRQVSQLVLRGFSGTWHGATAPAKASCRRKTFPVTVQQSTANALAFTVWGKTAGTGCQDLTIALEPVAANVFEGTVESVGKIKLVRR